MTAATDTNVRIHELIDYVHNGRILDAMREFYADDVVMEEPAYGKTVGLAANIEREQHFVDSVAQFKNFQANAIGIADNVAFYENVMDWVGVDGKDYHVEQVSVQTWRDGKIVHERFYYATN